MARETYAFSQRELRYRATLPLTAEMKTFLNEISDRCKREGGKHMDGSQILRAAIRMLMKHESQVDWKNIDTEEELVRRLIKAFSKR